MNKLSDAIRSAQQRGGRRLGFGASRADPGPPKRGLLIAALGPERSGADVQILPAGASDGLKAAVDAAGDAALGLAPPRLSRDDVTAAEAAGVAFVIFTPATTTADALLSETLEYGVRLEGAAADEAELRAIGSLRPVLLLIDRPADPLPVTDLLALRRVAMLTGAPLAAPVAPDASPGLLQALRDSGVALVLLDGPAAGQVETLRARIAELPERSRRLSERAEPSLPSVQPAEDEDDEFDQFATTNPRPGAAVSAARRALPGCSWRSPSPPAGSRAAARTAPR